MRCAQVNNIISSNSGNNKTTIASETIQNSNTNTGKETLMRIETRNGNAVAIRLINGTLNQRTAIMKTKLDLKCFSEMKILEQFKIQIVNYKPIAKMKPQNQN